MSHDDQRRVAQCECGASIAWRGAAHAIAAGWARRWTDTGPVWLCPACRPAAVADDPPPPKLPGYLRSLIGDGQRVVALEQLELLRASDPVGFVACINEILFEAELAQTLRTRGKKGLWSMLARKYGRLVSGPS